MEAKPDNEPTQVGLDINTPAVLPAPVLSAPVLPAPGLPAPVYPPSYAPPGQAAQIKWMPQPSTIAGCPPGLEYLTQLDQILVHQQVDLTEALSALESENRYHIKNTLGQQVFFVQEESDPLLRQQLRYRRNFTMHVINNLNQEVMRVVRPSQHCTGASTVGVEAPPGQPIGHVAATFNLSDSRLEVFDASLKPVLKIRGVGCFCYSEGSDIDFRVRKYIPAFGLMQAKIELYQLMTPDESQQIGKISKQWSGQFQERYTTADNFGINFPMDLDVKVKATLLGALFLIDFLMFQQKPIHNSQERR